MKLRGMRIEAGEVEAQLRRLPGVKEAVVSASALVGRDGEAVSPAASLVAYIVPGGGAAPDSAGLRKSLRQVLPDYMVPEVFVALEALPLTRTGKVDRKALPAPAAADLQRQAYAAPRNETEAVLCGLWQDILKLERVGIEDNFFESGGHSLLATRLLSRIRQALGVELPLRALFEHPTIAALAGELAGQSCAYQGALLEPIGQADRSLPLPLSFAQQRLWFIDQLEGGSTEYNLPLRLAFTGPMDAGALERSLQAIVARHEVLRTAIVSDEGRARQLVRAGAAAGFAIDDLRALEPAQREQAHARLAREEAARPFDLARDVLLRARLVRLEQERQVLLLTLHHIAADGWSMGVLLRELNTLYDAYSQGREPALAPLPVQYADYAAWQRGWLQGAGLERQLGYWRGQLAGLPAVHGLPLDKPRPAQQRFHARTLAQGIDAGLLEGIEAYCRRGQATLFMFLQTALAVLLQRYSGESDIVIGSPIAGRAHAEVEGLVGLFVNSLVLRSDLSDNPAFEALLARNRQMILGAYEHQHVPFEMLVEELRPERSLSYSPLYQVMLTLHNNEQHQLALRGLSLDGKAGSHDTIKCDLELTASVHGGQLYIDWVYNTDLFEQASVARMANNFEQLLRSIVARPQARIGELALLADAERETLLHGWNDSGAVFGGPATLPALFEAQAAATPDATALRDEAETLSYAELNARANRLAHYLRAQGVADGGLVGLCMERSAAMVVGLLAILKAGAAYVPLDPEYPAARLAFMLEDAGVELVLAGSASLDALPAEGARTICLDEHHVRAALLAMDTSNVPVPVRPEQLAYVIYTSGSTGLPKGVCIEHLALANLLRSMALRPGASAADRLLAVTSICFDIAALELFLPLICGAQLHVASRAATRDSDALQALVAERGITIMQATPATWRLLLDGGWQGAPGLAVLCGGEAWSVALNRRLQGKVRSVWNVYGPTETTIWSTIDQVGADDLAVSMGQAVANTELYVLDRHGNLAPTGGVGELHIGGAGLARGYWNRPELTGERFVPHPFQPGARLYRTGDLVRWNAQGKLEYLSRIDHQVKIRGFRIETGEIETRLSTLELVRNTVVLAKPLGGEGLRLVAYVEPAVPMAPPGPALEAQKLEWVERCRRHLGQSLPDFMVPETYVFMAAFPLTSNRKVDRKALPEPSAADLGTAGYRAPRTERERLLCQVWQRVLELEQVGVTDSFFALGGDSILSIAMVAQARQAGIALSVKDVFEHKTVERLARAGGDAPAGAGDLQPFALLEAPEREAIAAGIEDAYPASPAQVGIIVQSQRHPGLYHDVFSFRVRARWDEALFREALAHLAARHPALRTSFDFEGARPLQLVHAQAQLALSVADVTAMPAAARQARLAELVAAEHARPFHAGQAPLLRVFAAPDGAEEFDYGISFHHAIMDGWSASVFTASLLQAYRQRLAGAALAAAPVNHGVREHAALQQAAHGNADSRAYWQAVLERADGYQLPRKAGAGDPAAPASQRTLAVPAVTALSGRLIALARSLGVPMQSVLLAAHFKVLAALSNRTEVVTTIGLSGRPETSAAADALGLFVNAAPLAASVGGGSWSTLVAAVDGAMGAAMEHRHYPLSGLPACLSETLFNYTHFHAYREAGGSLLSGRAFIEQTDFDFHVSFHRSPDDRIAMEIKYRPDCYDDDMVEQAAERYLIALERMLHDVHAEHRAAPLLTAREADLLQERWSRNPAPYPRGVSVHALFEAQAARAPARIAATCGDASITYGRLNQRANQLARYLRSLGVGRDQLVGMLVERDLDMLVAMLGILKAGAAYVPIDAGYPAARIAFMLEDSQARVVVGAERLAHCLPARGGLRVVGIDAPDTAAALSALDGADLPPLDGEAGSALAYVIYTSGSTGNPKGVMVEHANIVSLVSDTSYIEAGEEAVIAQASSVSFDAATFEIWTALTRGARLATLQRDCLLNAEALAAFLRGQGVTTMFMTTALVNRIASEMPDCLAPLRTLLFGGEEVNYAAVAQVLSHCPALRLVHVYGPTETTTFASYARLEGSYGAARPIPIGRPMENMELYVVGNEGLAPVGARGELYIGGAGVARGYLARPELSAQRFLPHPYGAAAGQRIYATGDMVRWLADGQIEFLGRVDRQVKINGFRIELPEVEAALAALPDIRESLVRVVADGLGGRRMVAYIVPRSGAVDAAAGLAAACRQQLKAALPEYMIPSALVALAALPLNANGKVDLQALPAPEDVREDGAGHVAPRFELERQLCAIWQEVLKRGGIGVTDNFFEAGGSSLLVMQLQRRIARATGREVGIADLFAYPTIADLTRHLLQREGGTAAVPETAAPPRARVEPVAVIGMAGRFPGARDIEALWRNLAEGAESIDQFSDQQLAAAGVPEQLINHPGYVKRGVLLEDLDQFDAGYFGLTPREAQIMDPQQRLLFECTLAALEQAGYGRWDRHQHVGVFVSVADSRYLTENIHSNPELFDAVGALAIRNANSRDGAATRLSYKFNLTGPSVNINTACSSSLVAVHEACKSLWLGECGMALAGGADISLLAAQGYLYSEGDVMSPDGHCRAFDQQAAGTRLGSGAGLVLLKPLSAALADGDTIHGLITGSAINNDGAAKVGYTAPSVGGQADCIRRAHAAAGVAPTSIGYVEAHGTGTRIGDPIEIAALASAFGGAAGRPYCAIGSVKTNIGHLNTAAGIAGLIKTLECVKRARIPASLHYRQANPQIDFGASPFFVNAALREWDQGGVPRRAGVSSFGIGGTNAHVVVEQAPPPPPAGAADAPQLLRVSGRSEAAVLRMCGDLAAHLASHPAVSLADVAYTLQAGRRRHEYNHYLVAQGREEAIARLEAAVERREVARSAGAGRSVPVVFMFPGQGSQYAGMACGLYDAQPVFRQWVDTCLDKLAPHLALDLGPILLPHLHGADPDQVQAQLSRTEVVQPALFVTEYALAMMWKALGLEPAAMIGHSIGEYVAACLAGVFSLDDALKLVAARGRLMQGLPGGAMLSVALGAQDAAGLALETGCCVAAINSPRNCVLAGERDIIAGLAEVLRERGVEHALLPTTHAFHSRMMEPIAAQFAQLFDGMELGAPQLPFISNLSGAPCDPGQVRDPAYWVRHLLQTVNFAAGIDTLLQRYDGLFLEIGPGNTLSSLGRKGGNYARQRFVSTLRHRNLAEGDLRFLLKAAGEVDLAQVDIAWPLLHAGQARRRVPLPAYPLQRERHWVERKLVRRAPEAPLAAGRKPLADWFSGVAWKRAAGAPPERIDLAAQRGCWLVFTDRYGIGDQLVAALEAAQQAVVRVGFGPNFVVSGSSCTIRSHCEEDYQALFAVLAVRGQVPERVVHMGSLALPAAAPRYQDFLQAQHSGLLSLVYLVRHWTRSVPSAQLGLHVVTNDLFDVLGNEVLMPAQSTIAGICNSIPQEYPQVACCHLDLALTPHAASELALRAALAGRIAAELSLRQPERLVALRAGARWHRVFEPLAAHPAAAAHAFVEGGVYFITGGLGRIGLALAQQLCERFHADVVLAGRSLPSADDAAGAARLARIDACSAQGGRIRLVQADAAERDAMAAALDAAEREFGRIDGIIHCAGDVADAIEPLETISEADCLRQFLPKAGGLLVLDELLREREVGFCMAMSSLSAILGGIGFGVYAGSNIYMDTFCHEKHRSGDRRWLSVNWDGWNFAQTAEDKFFDMLHENHIPGADAVAALSQALRIGHAPQLVCSTTGLEARHRRWIERAGPAQPEAAPPQEAVAAADGALLPVPDNGRNGIDEALLGIWRDLFGMAQVGIRDNFFELGGDSLLLARLLARIRAEFGERADTLTLASMFHSPSIEGISDLISAAASIWHADRSMSAISEDATAFEDGEI
ncbi:amino acid adenylation domain-containing protein [Oxalobacteraceae bacterium A2-2]